MQIKSMLEKKYTVIQEEHDDLSDSLEEILEFNSLIESSKNFEFIGQIVVAEDQFINL
jgi:ACT domain-containing protein